MRFIGGKTLMIDHIMQVVKENTYDDVLIVGDLFSGSGIVSQSFKESGKQVISNDIMYMSYVLARGMTELNTLPRFECLGEFDVFQHLNNLIEPLSVNDAFIYKNYSPNESCERMYFQPQNAKKIDAIRQQIETWFLSGKLLESEYYYLLACLITAVPFVSNITGIYGAYLKYWDKRTYNELRIEPIKIIGSKYNCKSFNMDATELCKKQSFDLVYIDTPYNNREYLPNYHILETIAKYDNPTIKGVTGLRSYCKSSFCSKSTVGSAFEKLFENLDSKYAVVSYNTEGLLNTAELTQILNKFGNVKLYEYPYRRYKSKIPNNGNGLKEQLYFVKLRRNK